MQQHDLLVQQTTAALVRGCTSEFSLLCWGNVARIPLSESVTQIYAYRTLGENGATWTWLHMRANSVLAVYHIFRRSGHSCQDTALLALYGHPLRYPLLLRPTSFGPPCAMNPAKEKPPCPNACSW